MPFFAVTHRPKPADEPEQLDLFGYPSHEPVPASQCAISPSVVSQVAWGVCSHHGLGGQYANHIRNWFAHQPGGDPGRPEWRDYVVGLASSMSFWPTSIVSTFQSSDRDALASDWASVQSDLNLVWQAITTAERICNEQRERERRETKTVK
jgi:hypothetical protein